MLELASYTAAAALQAQPPDPLLLRAACWLRQRQTVA